jgi:hypothetical protein
MNALSPIRPAMLGRSAVFAPRFLTPLGLAIERLEELTQGPEMDAEIFRALGWQVAPPASPRSAWRVRSPYASTWMPQPPVTTLTDGAAILVPPGWDYGTGRRGAHAFAWCRRGGGAASQHSGGSAAGQRFTETTSATPALALARAAPHAWRHILMESDTP